MEEKERLEKLEPAEALADRGEKTETIEAGSGRKDRREAGLNMDGELSVEAVRRWLLWAGLALGICLGVHDLAFRCDLTGLSGDGPAFEEMQMGGPGALAGKEEEAYISVKEAMGKESALSLVPGRNGKCLLLWKDGLLKSPGLMNDAAGGCGLVPPHEMMGKRIGDFLPEQRAEVFRGQLSGAKGKVSPGARLLLALGYRDRL